jgi:hypothetical protein
MPGVLGVSRRRFSLALTCAIALALALGAVCARVGSTSAQYSSTVLEAAVLQASGPVAMPEADQVLPPVQPATDTTVSLAPDASGESTPTQ